MRPSARAFALMFSLAGALGMSACSPQLGDSCSTALNCSVNGDRACDVTQPGGACISYDCQADQCADDAVCVRFHPAEPRRSLVACMRRCHSDGDCRTDEGYRCIDSATYDDGLFSEVVDRERPDARFCAATAP